MHGGASDETALEEGGAPRPRGAELKRLGASPAQLARFKVLKKRAGQTPSAANVQALQEFLGTAVAQGVSTAVAPITAGVNSANEKLDTMLARTDPLRPAPLDGVEGNLR